MTNAVVQALVGLAVSLLTTNATIVTDVAETYHVETSTNVVEASGAHTCPYCNIEEETPITSLESHDFLVCPVTWPATKKTKTTIVESVWTLYLNWRGQGYTMTERQVLNTVVEQWKETADGWKKIK